MIGTWSLYVARKIYMQSEGGCGGEACGFVCANMCFSLQGIGDTNLAHQCFRLALVHNNHHAEAYNNLAVLEMRKGHIEQVRELHCHSGQLAFFRRKL